MSEPIADTAAEIAEISKEPAPTDRIERDYMGERWFALLEAAVKAHPRGNQGVADRLGKGGSRTAVSMVLKGTYTSTLKKIVRRVLEVYDIVHCPYFGANVQTGFCETSNAERIPTWDPAAMDLRRCCQTCPHKPDGGTK